MIQRVACIAVGLLFLGQAPLAQSGVSETQDQPPSPEIREKVVRVGIGGKLVSGLPFVTLTVRFGTVGVDAAVGFSLDKIQGTSVMLTWYDLVGRLYFPIPEIKWFVPYMGGGAVGFTASMSIPVNNMTVPASVTARGLHLMAGLELRLGTYGVMLGIDWLLITGATVNVAGLELTVPVTRAGTGYHIGVRREF